MTASTDIEADKRAKTVNMFVDSWQDHLAAVSMKTQVTGAHRVTVDKKCDATNAYNPGGFSSSSIDKALESIMTSSRTPNCKQGQFLRHFVERLKLEYLEHHLGKINQGLGEPLLDVVHGSPGSGKSAVIRWMCQLMEEGLGWKRSVQFICLNAPKAIECGVHGWSAIFKRNDNKHNRALRVIIIDQVRVSEIC